MIIKSTTIPLPTENIDTDQIIPAKFLKQVDKKGYGKNLFANWRYLKNGEINPDFILNKLERSEAKILIAGNNFGCGSSREHAAWAIAGYGIKAVISSQFADIFKGNAYNNVILPITLEKDALAKLLEASSVDASLEIEIDLQAQSITCAKIDLSETFDIHPFKKECLIEGVDETNYLIKQREEIVAFEQKRNTLAAV